MAIPTKIKQLAHDVRNKIYGKDVRESIAESMEESGDVADNARQTSEDAVDKVNIYKSQFDQSILDGDQPAEVQTLRVDPITGEVYTIAADRFEANQRAAKEVMDRHALDLNSKSLNVLMFGAVGDEENDDTNSIIAAITATPNNGTLVIPRGFFRTTRTILVDKPINFIMDGIIVADHEGIAIKLNRVGRGGGNSSRIVLKARKKVKNHYGNSVGIELHNSYHNEVSIPFVGNFTTNVKYSADEGAGTVYNNTFLGEIYGGKIQLHIIADNATKGWTNQNNFYGGRLYHSDKDDSREGYVQVLIEGDGGDKYRNNGNNFYGTSIEDVGINGEFALAVQCDGIYNSFNDIRTEGSMKWKFGVDSYRNVVNNGTYIYLRNMEDLGTFNKFETIGAGSRSVVQDGTHKFIAGANGTTAITAEGNGVTRVPIRAYNRAGGSSGALQVMTANGEEISVSIPTNGMWTVKDGTRKVYFGAYLTHPPNGKVGDISFVTTPIKHGPIGYVCYSNDNGGLWRPFGGLISKQYDSDAQSVEGLKNHFNYLLDRLRGSGLMDQ